MSLTAQKTCSIVIIIEYAAVPSIGIGECVGAVEVVQHGEVCSGVHDVQVRRPPGGLRPVDHSGDPIAFPQDVSGMKVTVYQALVGRRGTLSEDVDGPSPELRPRGSSSAPQDHLEPRTRTVAADDHHLPACRG